MQKYEKDFIYKNVCQSTLHGIIINKIIIILSRETGDWGVFTSVYSEEN